MLTDKQINAACSIFGNIPLTDASIKLRYRELAKLSHPDIVKDDGKAMVRVNRAYEILTEAIETNFTHTVTETKTTTTTTTKTTTTTSSRKTTNSRKPVVRVKVGTSEEVKALVDPHPTDKGKYICSVMYTEGISLKVGKNDWIIPNKPCQLIVGKVYLSIK